MRSPSLRAASALALRRPVHRRRRHRRRARRHRSPGRGAATSRDGGWLRPVDGPVVRPFDAPASEYAAGHRGVDFAVARRHLGPRRQRRRRELRRFASPARSTSPSPTPAACARRTRSWRRSRCAPVRRSPAATSSGRPVASGTTTTARCCTSGSASATATSIRCCCSARPISPSWCASCPRANPTRRRGRRPGNGASCRRHCACPTPGAGIGGAVACARRRATPASPSSAARSTRCASVGSWLGDGVDGAIDAGIGFLDATTDLADSALEGLRASVHASADAMRALSGRARRPARPDARRASWRSTSSPSGGASPTPSPPTAATTPPTPTAPEGRRTG